MTRFALTLALVPLLAACSSGSTGNSSAASLVANAAQQTLATHTTTVSCFSDFQACIDKAATDADVTACQATLASCLPAPSSVGANGVPDLCNATARGDGDGDGHGGRCHGDGGMGSPPDGGDDDRGGPGGGRHGGDHGRIPVSPAGRIALATCHAELKKCLAASTDAATCTATAHTCVHDALVVDFTQLCAAVASQCASCPTTNVCTELTARCAAGLTFPDHGGSSATTGP